MSASAGAIVGYSLLGSFGAYVLTSVLLLKYPGLLHTKKKRKIHCAHISHRGGAGEYLENTMLAFRNAVDIGTDMLELDVHLSKDKKVVISHDDDLLRCTGFDGKISDYNYEELPCLKDVLDITFSTNAVCTHVGDKQRMPLLEEIFQEFPHIPVNLDVKDNDDELIDMTNDLIRKYKREDNLIWGNFRKSVIEKCLKKNPDVEVMFSVQRTIWLVVWFYSGLLPFIPLRESFLEIPYTNMKMNTQLSRGQQRFSRLYKLLISKTMINHLKARGIATYFWVVNDDEDFEGAFELGAEGVMTDFPRKLKTWLDLHPQYWNTWSREDEDGRLLPASQSS